MTDDLSYRDALDELRVIHGRLRAEDVDVDTLLEEVQRAADLLASVATGSGPSAKVWKRCWRGSTPSRADA